MVKVFDETMNRVRGWIEAAQCVANVRPIHVGHKMAAQQRRREGRQRARGHRRAEVGSADADVDDVRHWLPERPSRPPLANVGGETEHFVACRNNVGHHVAAVDGDWRSGEIAQGRVQDGAVLCGVDLGAGEHCVALRFDPARLGELDESPQNAGVNALLGKIKQEIVEGDAELLKSRRIAGEICSCRPREHALAHAGQFCQCR